MTKSAIMRRRSYSLLAIVLALAGALLQACWPLIAAAGPEQRTIPIAQLCSVNGSRYAPADDAPASPLRQHIPHCAYCSLNPGNGLLPPAMPALMPGSVQVASIALPPQRVFAPQQRTSIHDGYPRPPPALA